MSFSSKRVRNAGGQQLAWLDLLIDTISFTSEEQVGTAQVVVHDLVSGTIHVVDSFPITGIALEAGVFDVQWSRSGVAVKIGLGAYASTWDLRVYNPSGDLITETPLKRKITPGCSLPPGFRNKSKITCLMNI